MQPDRQLISQLGTRWKVPSKPWRKPNSGTRLVSQLFGQNSARKSKGFRPRSGVAVDQVNFEMLPRFS